jgi:hypothetical protein
MQSTLPEHFQTHTDKVGFADVFVKDLKYVFVIRPLHDWLLNAKHTHTPERFLHIQTKFGFAVLRISNVILFFYYSMSKH